MKKLLAIMLTLVMSLSVFTAGTAGAAWIADMDEDNWAYGVASEMVDAGIMDVDQDGNFNPTIETSRGEFVLYLWRIFGEEEVTIYGQTFVDVSAENGYYLAVEWCSAAGITNGVGGNRFDLYGALTREMAFTFLYRAMDYMGVAPTYDDGHEMLKQITEFDDYLEVSDWAADAVQLLLDVGIVRGGGDYLWPGRDLNNAQTAALLSQYLEYL